MIGQGDLAIRSGYLEYIAKGKETEPAGETLSGQSSAETVVPEFKTVKLYRKDPDAGSPWSEVRERILNQG